MNTPILPTTSKAFNGPLGGLINEIKDRTEASESSVLCHCLAMYGHVVGRNACVKLGDIIQYPNLFFSLVGDSGYGSKGTSRSIAQKIVEATIPDETILRIVSGIGSGQAIIEMVRDPRMKTVKGKEELDLGITDKRLQIIEEEFGTILSNQERSGDKTSHILRQAWEGSKLQSATLSNPFTATDAHISLIGHVTAEELRKYSKGRTSTVDGFYNRFLWIWTNSSKTIPIPQAISSELFQTMLQLPDSDLFNHSNNNGSVAFELSEDSIEWWKQKAAILKNPDSPTAFLTARTRPQVLRLALIYAILDCETEIKLPHLESALSLVEYSNSVVNYLFANGFSENALKVLKRFQTKRTLTRTEISHGVFQKNQKAVEIDRVKEELAEYISLTYSSTTETWKLDKNPTLGVLI